VLVLLVGAGVGAVVSYFVRLSIFNSLDRLLGLVFGLLRGAVVLGVLAMLCHAVRLNEETWYRGSTLVPYAEQAGNVLRGLVGERKIRASPMTA
jgi:membrane protein required for colicin V production